MMYALAIISFLLDSVFLNLLSPDSFFCPLFSLLTVLICYPLVEKSSKQYYFLCGILGLLYDICYTDSLFFHTLFFIFLGYFFGRVYQKFQVNFLNTFFLGIGTILFYRIVLALFFSFLPGFSFDTSIFLKSIFSSLLLNSLYLIVFYFFVKKIRLKWRNRRYSTIELEK